MAYANKLAVPFAVLLGEDEIAQGKCSVKDMASGEQRLLTPGEAAQWIGEKLRQAEDLPMILEK